MTEAATLCVHCPICGTGVCAPVDVSVECPKCGHWIKVRKEDERNNNILDVKLTVKCGMNATIKQLGIEKYMNRKVLVLRDRDESLQSFGEMEPVPAAQQSIS